MILVACFFPVIAEPAGKKETAVVSAVGKEFSPSSKGNMEGNGSNAHMAAPNGYYPDDDNTVTRCSLWACFGWNGEGKGGGCSMPPQVGFPFFPLRP